MRLIICINWTVLAQLLPRQFEEIDLIIQLTI